MLMDDHRTVQVEALIEPILADRNMELVELSCRPYGGGQLLRILVDKIGGVTLQQCAHVNHLIGQALETANLFEGSYTIEVSSPGLDRPLVTKRDFERALGEELDVSVNAGEGRFTAVQGMLLAVQHEAIVLKTSSGNVTVPFGQIHTVKKSVRW